MRELITTVGSITLDIDVQTSEGVIIDTPSNVRRTKLLAFEYGAKLESQSFDFFCGGGAANSATTFQSLGLKPRLIGAVGNDVFADICLQSLKDRGIGTKAVQKLRMQTSSSIIVNSTRDHAHCIFVYRGASDRLSVTPRLARSITTPWLYITTLTGAWKQNLNALFDNAKRCQQRVAWNPGSQQLAARIAGLRRYLQRTYLFIVNQDEAVELLLNSHKRITSAQSVELAKSLHAYGPSMVVVTNGHYGSVLYDGSRVYRQPALKVNLKSKTGAGDAFGSGLVTGLIKYRSIRPALALAMYNSASVVEHFGAQTGVLSINDLRKLKIA